MNGQQVNAGGVLSPEEVIGRDVFIERAWWVLEKQGLYLTGERRMGKSSIIREKMGTHSPDGYKLLYFDVADADTPLAFVDGLFQRAKQLAQGNRKFKLTVLEAARRLLPNLEIAQLVRLPESLAPSWKEILRAVLADFADSETKLILAFDEMPLMLDKIKRTSGDNAAMDVLDTLRKERQSDRRLRMIYTGSLGLHHVLASLQDINYQNTPYNDLKLVEVGPLLEDDARDLAWLLINGMGIRTEEPEVLARHLARITHGMSFYIQHLVGDLADTGSLCTLEMADSALTRRLTDLTDPWDLGYYKTRIDSHYQPSYQPVALAFLDQLAFAPETSLTFDDLWAGLDPNKVKTDEETAQRTIELLGKDHYIGQDERGSYRFRYPLIARAWAYKRGRLGRTGR